MCRYCNDKFPLVVNLDASPQCIAKNLPPESKKKGSVMNVFDDI